MVTSGQSSMHVGGRGGCLTRLVDQVYKGQIQWLTRLVKCTYSTDWAVMVRVTVSGYCVVVGTVLQVN